MKSLLALSLFLIFGPSIASAQTKVLVSYFKPFGGRKENHTKAVAQALAQMKELKVAGIQVVLCPLDAKSNGMDVSFHSPRKNLPISKSQSVLNGKTNSYRQVLACMKQHPDVKFVYSLGEAHCNIAFENVAYNAMETGPESKMRDHNDNRLLTLLRIDENEEGYRKLDGNSNLRAYCFSKLLNPEFSKLAEAGTDPGTFVCNNLAYNVQKYISERGSDIKYEFVHVPRKFSNLSEAYCDEPKIPGKTRGEKEKNFTRGVASTVSEFIKNKHLLTVYDSLKDTQCRPEVLPIVASTNLVHLLAPIFNAPEMKKCLEHEAKAIQKQRLRIVARRLKAR